MTSYDDEWDPRDGAFSRQVTAPEHHQGMEAMCAFLLSVPGQKALAWLRSLTVERTVSPSVCSDAALWHREGQRDLVLDLQRRSESFYGQRS